MARYDLHHGKSPLEVAIVTGAGAEIVEFTTNEALTAGDWVGLDTSQTGEDRVTEVVQGNADGMVIGCLRCRCSGVRLWLRRGRID